MSKTLQHGEGGKPLHRLFGGRGELPPPLLLRQYLVSTRWGVLYLLSLGGFDSDLPYLEFDTVRRDKPSGLTVGLDSLVLVTSSQNASRMRWIGQTHSTVQQHILIPCPGDTGQCTTSLKTIHTEQWPNCMSSVHKFSSMNLPNSAPSHP